MEVRQRQPYHEAGEGGSWGKQHAVAGLCIQALMQSLGTRLDWLVRSFCRK